MLKKYVRQVLDITLIPFIWVFSPIFYFVARTGTGVNICRRMGFQPLLVHFYQPIPQYETVPEEFFTTPQEFPGFEIASTTIHESLQRLGKFADECDWRETQTKSGQYYAQNQSFGFSSATLLHTIIRSHQTKRIIEIGGGYSSLVSLAALQKNYPDGSYHFSCIEPYPTVWLQNAITKHRPSATLVQSKAEDIALDTYLALEENDIFFIDSSHVAKLNSDVNYLYLQILPQLKAGVIVHIHDIYIPYEYPRVHFHGKHKYYWNEQYLLQAFLTSNPNFEVILPGYLIQKDKAETFKASFPTYDPQKHRPTSSFWIRKIR